MRSVGGMGGATTIQSHRWAPTLGRGRGRGRTRTRTGTRTDDVRCSRTRTRTGTDEDGDEDGRSALLFYRGVDTCRFIWAPIHACMEGRTDGAMCPSAGPRAVLYNVQYTPLAPAKIEVVGGTVWAGWLVVNNLSNYLLNPQRVLAMQPRG